MNAVKVPRVSGPPDHPRPAVEEHHRRAPRQQQPRQPARQVPQPRHPEERVNKRVITPLEPPRLPVAGIGRRHQPHAPQRLDQERPDVGAPLPHHAHANFQPTPVAHQRPDGGREESCRRQEQLPVEPQQHTDRAQQKRHVAQPRQHRVREHPLDFAHVVVQARHDVAQRRPREETGRQPLQVTVHDQAHVEEDLGRHLRVAQPADDVQHEAGNRYGREQNDDPDEGVEVPPQQRVVDEVAGEKRDVQGERRPGQIEAQDERQPALVRDDVGESPAEFRVQYGHWQSVVNPSSASGRRPAPQMPLPQLPRGPVPSGIITKLVMSASKATVRRNS